MPATALEGCCCHIIMTARTKINSLYKVFQGPPGTCVVSDSMAKCTNKRFTRTILLSWLLSLPTHSPPAPRTHTKKYLCAMCKHVSVFFLSLESSLSAQCLMWVCCSGGGLKEKQLLFSFGIVCHRWKQVRPRPTPVRLQRWSHWGERKYYNTRNQRLRPSFSLILWDKLWNKQSAEWILSVMGDVHTFYNNTGTGEIVALSTSGVVRAPCVHARWDLLAPTDHRFIADFSISCLQSLKLPKCLSGLYIFH